MKQLILHIGLHKTGSTSLQGALQNNSKLLHKHNFYFPIFTYKMGRYNNHSVPLFTIFSDSPEKNFYFVKNNIEKKDALKVQSKFLSQLEEAIAKNNKIILSAEGLSMLSATNLEKLKKLFFDNGFDIKVVAFVRRPYSFLCSYSQERVKHGQSYLSNTEFPSKISMIKRFESIFNDVRFYSYEEACKHDGGVIRYFFEKIGVKGYQETDTRQYNKSLGNLSTRIYSFLYDRIPTIINGKLNPQQLNIPILSFDDEKYLLTKKELAIYKVQLDKENQFFRKHLGEEFCDKQYQTIDELKLSKKAIDEINQKIVLPSHALPFLDEFFRKNSSEEVSEQFYLSSQDENQTNIQLTPQVVELFRDVAVMIEGQSPEKANQLMQLAYMGRPKGLHIIEKLRAYKKMLDKRYKV